MQHGTIVCIEEEIRQTHESSRRLEAAAIERHLRQVGPLSHACLSQALWLVTQEEASRFAGVIALAAMGIVGIQLLRRGDSVKDLDLHVTVLQVQRGPMEVPLYATGIRLLFWVKM